MITDRLIDAIIRTKNSSIVGLDTAISYLPEDMKRQANSNQDAAELILLFNKKIIDAVHDIVPAVKVQSAYYEAYGVEGVRTFKETLLYAQSMGLITIADVKRNDIGSTSAAYSSAYLGINDLGNQAEFKSDYLTLNAYLGIDGIGPFIKDCLCYDKGAFILIRTSNPSSSEIQNIITQSGDMLYQVMGRLVAEWGKTLMGNYGYSSIGAVVGATHRKEAEYLRSELSGVFFLVPGYGAQGGKAEDLEVCFDNNGFGAIVNSSRAILCAYREHKDKTYPDAARQAAKDMREDINNVLVSKGKSRWLS